jgi:hypothetical protein
MLVAVGVVNHIAKETKGGISSFEEINVCSFLGWLPEDITFEPVIVRPLGTQAVLIAIFKVKEGGFA